MSDYKGYLIQLPDNKVFRFRGIKLLESTSRSDHYPDSERWINLTLYRSGEKAMVLVVEYDSNVTNPHEIEKPHIHVEEIRSWTGLAMFLDGYDFMQHVTLDYYCGGHCSLMSGSGKQYAHICHRFRRTAMDFLEECNLKDSKAFHDLRFDIW